ncbi:MAG: glycosyltransferase family 61 protein [Reichenbachiella sp.]|uniref:glycosyltransferase family 61 protein n=1 Tax=Reichenbachiella sp. TaxID=2184521 RepID=UPI003263D16C
MRTEISSLVKSVNWKIKQVKKIVYYKRQATAAFEKNQQLIAESLRHSNEINLIPVPPVGGDGTLDNYFHFIFDFLLPLFLIIERSPKVRIGIPFVNLGYQKKYLAKLFSDQVFDSSQNSGKLESIEMHGMNSLLVRSSLSQLSSFKSYVVNTLGIKLAASAKKVIVIERAAPREKMRLPNVPLSDTGSFKRNIVNHETFRAFLSENLKKEFEFVNVKLEYCSLEEQVQLFDQSILTIGQHGAGLANLIWMRASSNVLELRNDLLRRHYLNLSKYIGLNYSHYHQFGSHITLSKNNLNQMIRHNSDVQQFFNVK